MVLSKYDPVVYDSLGDIEEVSKEIVKEEREGVGAIILKYNKGDRVVLVIAHRHHALKANEAMLEEQVGDDRIAKPARMEEIFAKSAHPNLLFCSADGKWVPTGFSIDNEVDGFGDPWCDEAFLREVGDYLIQNNLQHKFLLATRASGDAKDQGIQFVEHNYEETRTSKTSPCSGEVFDESIPTTYAFKRNADGVAEEGCFVGCVGVMGFHMSSGHR